MNKHCSYRGKNIAFVILFLIHLINNFTCIYSAKPDHCLPSAKCLVCEDENIMKEIDSCKTCCETESIGQCSDACTECFVTKNSTIQGDIDGSGSTCDLFAKCKGNSSQCSTSYVTSPLVVAKSHPCGFYSGGKSCCGALQKEVKESLETIKSRMLGLFDKCEMCGEAWERVFCAASCSPHQASFVKQTKRVDGSLGYTLNLQKELAVSLWRSCQDDDKQPETIDEYPMVFKIDINLGSEEKNAIKFAEDPNIISLNMPTVPGHFEIKVVDDETNGLTGHDLGLYEGNEFHVYEFCYSRKDTLVTSASYTIFRVMLLFTGACIGNYLHLHHILWLPESGVFIILGMIYGAGSLWLMGPSASTELSFDPDMLTLVLLPPIIFYSGFSMEHSNFGANLNEILIFAFFGTLISTTTVGLTIFSLKDIGGDYPSTINIWESFAFAALISAVDPVATLATFSALKVDPNLEVLVFGESLLNDAVSIVIFKSFAKFTKYGGITSSFGIEDAIGKFVSLSLGSIAIGFGIGAFHALVFKYTFFKHTAVLEILVFLTLAYSSFLIAEMFHFSGIVASLIHGAMAAVFVKPNMSYEGHQRASILTNTLASLADMLIFLLTGLVTVVNYQDLSWSLTAVTLVTILVARFLAVFPLVAIVNLCRKPERRISKEHAIVMWWSGLRGAIAIGLCAGVPTPLKHQFMSTTVVVVLFTVFFLGGGTPALLKSLKIGMGKDKPEAHGEISNSMKRVTIALTKILCNYDEDNDGIDDRYESAEYLEHEDLQIPGTVRHVPDKKKKTKIKIKGVEFVPTESNKKSIKGWAPLDKKQNKEELREAEEVSKEEKTSTSGKKGRGKNKIVPIVTVDSEEMIGINSPRNNKSPSRSKSQSTALAKLMKCGVKDKTMNKFLPVLQEYKNGSIDSKTARETSTKILKGNKKAIECLELIFPL